MSDDLVKRLRGHATEVEDWDARLPVLPIPFAADLREAADRIEALTAAQPAPWISIRDGEIVGTPFGPEIPNGKYTLTGRLNSEELVDPMPPIGSVGTLAELRVKEGDTVEVCDSLRRHEISGKLNGGFHLTKGGWLLGDSMACRLISRASRPTTSPVRTVTKREIVPGVYGTVKIWPDGDATMFATHSVEALTAAIATLTEIRDALADQDEPPLGAIEVG